MILRDLTTPDFVAGKALFLRRLTHSWDAALAKADWYASLAEDARAKAMWSAVATHIRATLEPEWDEYLDARDEPVA